MSYIRDDAGVMARLSPKLLDQVRGRLLLRHYSLRIEQAYVGRIRRFILSNGKRHSMQRVATSPWAAASRYSNPSRFTAR